ncbi:hypothetical protein GPECTOR_15g467 [Gonium pectorale]|uniref:Uncharacterized protein n=1 Tax=Gonium pectorale TaxID=33097 RepID=A0A150GLY9_GONPE|nr:hypothetical protein GPECTOR_15g467 [Gonium pectorale]|eukprot:KXZ50782.1 hypothetical protein GPECTOR_15g467 [Gonium pectorale]
MALSLTQRSAQVASPKHAAVARSFVPVRPIVVPASTCHPSTSSSAKASNTVRIIIQGRKLPVTDAIKQYVEEKVGRTVHNFAHTLKEVDVTLSARGGDTGTHGKK